MARYWVGGDGYWDDPSHWSIESGGVSGSSEPSSSDDVIFDENSSSVDMRVEFVVGGQYPCCKSLTCTNITNKITFYINSFFILFGNITLSNNVIFKIHGDTNYENVFNGIIEKGIYISGNCDLTSNGVQMPTIICNVEYPVYIPPDT